MLLCETHGPAHGGKKSCCLVTIEELAISWRYLLTLRLVTSAANFVNKTLPNVGTMAQLVNQGSVELPTFRSTSNFLKRGKASFCSKIPPVVDSNTGSKTIGTLVSFNL